MLSMCILVFGCVQAGLPLTPCSACSGMLVLSQLCSLNFGFTLSRELWAPLISSLQFPADCPYETKTLQTSGHVGRRIVGST